MKALWRLSLLQEGEGMCVKEDRGRWMPEMDVLTSWTGAGQP